MRIEWLCVAGCLFIACGNAHPENTSAAVQNANGQGHTAKSDAGARVDDDQGEDDDQDKRVDGGAKADDDQTVDGGKKEQGDDRRPDGAKADDDDNQGDHPGVDSGKRPDDDQDDNQQ